MGDLDEILEKRAERLRLEKRVTLLLEEYVDLETDEVRTALDEEHRRLEETRKSLEALESVLTTGQRKLYEKDLSELETDRTEEILEQLGRLSGEIAELKERADRFFERFKEELGPVTIKDSNNLWELERLACELEDQIDGIEVEA